MIQHKTATIGFFGNRSVYDVSARRIGRLTRDMGVGDLRGRQCEFEIRGGEVVGVRVLK